MDTIENPSKNKGIDTKRIKELILEDLEAFTSDDVEELEDLLNTFVDWVVFRKAWIEMKSDEDSD